MVAWLPLHFAVTLQKPNPSDISAIFSSNPESIRTGSDSRLMNPCHLFSMSSSNPNLMVLQQLKIHDYRMGQSITSYGSTSLHLAARHSNSVALIKELIRIHPPALRMLNAEGETPFCFVFENYYNNYGAQYIERISPGRSGADRNTKPIRR